MLGLQEKECSKLLRLRSLKNECNQDTNSLWIGIHRSRIDPNISTVETFVSMSTLLSNDSCDLVVTVGRAKVNQSVRAKLSTCFIQLMVITYRQIFLQTKALNKQQ